MKKKLFDLEDLYRFYEAKKEDVHFSADDEDSVLIVQEYGELNFNEDDYDPSDGLVPVTLHAFSDGINKNNIPAIITSYRNNWDYRTRPNNNITFMKFS